MKPRKRITRRVPLPRGKPPRARKKDPAKRRFAKLRNEAFQEYVRAQPCVVRLSVWLAAGIARPCWGPTECAHVKARGAGGADTGNCISLCQQHHAQQHTWGIKSFAKVYSLDLAKLAKELGDQWLAAHPRGGPQ